MTRKYFDRPILIISCNYAFAGRATSELWFIERHMLTDLLTFFKIHRNNTRSIL